MTLKAKIGIFLMDFSGDFELRHRIIHKAAPQTGVGGVASLVTRFGCNEVTLRWAQLVLRWVTACGQELL